MRNENKLINKNELIIDRSSNGLCTITLNNPRFKNALSENLTPYLRKELKRVKKDKNCRLLVLRGAGDSFCSGGNIKKMDLNVSKKKRSIKEKIEILKKKQLELTGLIYNLEIPTIAVITGAAAGAGFSLALSCDIRIGNKNSFFVSNYSRIGLSGDYGISWFLTDLLGTSKAKQIMFLNERIYSSEAFSLGLLNYIFEKEFEKNVNKIIQNIVTLPKVSLSFIKKNINYARHNNLKKSLNLEAKHLINSANHEEHNLALKNFIKKK